MKLFPILTVVLGYTISSYIYSSAIFSNNNFTLEKSLSGSASATVTQPVLEYTVISETPVPTATGTVTPTPTPTVYTVENTPTQINVLFEKYASKESVDINMLRKIAQCESGYNSQAVNGPYAGLFQFSSQTWITSRRMMNADTNPDLRFNAEESIKTAAFRIASGNTGLWYTCLK